MCIRHSGRLPERKVSVVSSSLVPPQIVKPVRVQSTTNSKWLSCPSGTAKPLRGRRFARNPPSAWIITTREGRYKFFLKKISNNDWPSIRACRSMTAPRPVTRAWGLGDWETPTSAGAGCGTVLAPLRTRRVPPGGGAVEKPGTPRPTVDGALNPHRGRGKRPWRPWARRLQRGRCRYLSRRRLWRLDRSTSRPWIKARSTCVGISRMSPLVTISVASLPGSRDPTRWSTPRISAG